jgi:serine/threonine-protein kinase MRCK
MFRILNNCFFSVLVKPIAKRVKELRLSRDDFEMLSLIGKGAFGEVCLGIFL